jgi:hypothetical protein
MEVGAGLVNEGFDGIAIKSGEKYNFSVFAGNPDKKSKKLLVRLIGKNGENYGETTINATLRLFGRSNFLQAERDLLLFVHFGW